METLINHQALSSLIYCGNSLGAIHFFKERYNDLKEQNCFSQCKLFVTSLNFSIYNYILLKENISLYDCCLRNNLQINLALDSNALYDVGENIIYAYSSCYDYLAEKFTHSEIKKAIYYIHNHLHEPFTLDDLCNNVGLNKCYFCTLFKTYTHSTFTQYLNTTRTNLAKKLITDTSLPLTEIAYRCGFNNYSYFCTTFKKVTGHSPHFFLKQK